MGRGWGDRWEGDGKGCKMVGVARLHAGKIDVFKISYQEQMQNDVRGAGGALPMNCEGLL